MDVRVLLSNPTIVSYLQSLIPIPALPEKREGKRKTSQFPIPFIRWRDP